MQRVLVTGAGGFIGHHLARDLVARGYQVRGVDLRYPAFDPSAAHEFQCLDLRGAEQCRRAVRDVDAVFHLAADMGGIGYITSNHASVARNNVLIDVNMLEASAQAGVDRFLFASSACIYPTYRQGRADLRPLKEEDAYPADPDQAYGWAKLFTERMCQYYREDRGLETRVARLHNVYGPEGVFDGGREKAPAALCRKVALAPDGGAVEIWGDGRQTRSFMYIADCVEGLRRIMLCDDPQPINLGTERLVTIDELVDIIAAVARKRITKRYDRSRPQGVRGRTSDNTRIRSLLGWEPTISLETGLAITYRWIEEQLRASTCRALPAEGCASPPAVGRR